MKRMILTVVVVALTSTTLLAQDGNEPQFLFKDSKVLLSGFGGPLAEVTCIGKHFALCNGGGGAFLLNQTFFIGGYGMGLSTNHFRDDLEDVVGIDHPKLYFNHGGLWLGYIHQHHKPIHFGFSAKVGGGEISLVDRYFQGAPFDDREGIDQIFVLSPQLEMELNLTAWFKVNAGFGWRYVGGVDRSYEISGSEKQQYYQASDFSTPYISVGLLFGWFNQSKAEAN